MANTEQIRAPKQPPLLVQIGILAAMTAAALGGGWMAGSYLKGTEVPPAPAAQNHDKAAEPQPAGFPQAGEGGVTLAELPSITTNLAAPASVWVRMDATVVFDGPQPPETVEAIHQDMLAFQSWLAAAAEKLAGTQGVTIAAPVTISDNMPTPGHAGLLDILDKAADAVGATHRRMASGAGHDTAWIAKVAPAAMIFVPCKEGRSHSADEWAENDDIALGAGVLLHATLAMDEALPLTAD